jgi:hypothetical protein
MLNNDDQQSKTTHTLWSVSKSQTWWRLCPGIVQTQHYITYLQSTRPNVAFPFICWATSSKTDFSLPYSLPETETCENKRIVSGKKRQNK